jgi:hypothetical protein
MIILKMENKDCENILNHIKKIILYGNKEYRGLVESKFDQDQYNLENCIQYKEFQECLQNKNIKTNLYISQSYKGIQYNPVKKRLNIYH